MRRKNPLLHPRRPGRSKNVANVVAEAVADAMIAKDAGHAKTVNRAEMPADAQTVSAMIAMTEITASLNAMTATASVLRASLNVTIGKANGLKMAPINVRNNVRIATTAGLAKSVGIEHRSGPPQKVPRIPC